jgi:hypothetical protein
MLSLNKFAPFSSQPRHSVSINVPLFIHSRHLDVCQCSHSLRSLPQDIDHLLCLPGHPPLPPPYYLPLQTHSFHHINHIPPDSRRMGAEVYCMMGHYSLMGPGGGGRNSAAGVKEGNIQRIQYRLRSTDQQPVSARHMRSLVLSEGNGIEGHVLCDRLEALFRNSLTLQIAEGSGVSEVKTIVQCFSFALTMATPFHCLQSPHLSTLHGLIPTAPHPQQRRQ